jgi:diguanylate cyclase (GGDEF)-like protein
MAILLADLDAFKPINDTYGHEAGDRALVHVATLLRDHVRASDSVGRLGGDEFGLILWHADQVAAQRKARSIEALIEASRLGLAEGTVTLGCSVGVAVLGPGETAEEALARADRAMYARKAERAGAG